MGVATQVVPPPVFGHDVLAKGSVQVATAVVALPVAFTVMFGGQVITKFPICFGVPLQVQSD